jgi:hypothetical protein
MTRTTSEQGPELVDDEPYAGVLLSAKVVPSKQEGWAPQIELDFELRQGGKLRDWVPTYLNVKGGAPSKLRQLLNAIAGESKDEACWFDPDTLEWGYDLEDDSSPPFLALHKAVGMAVQFRGEKPAKDKRYRITSYRMLDSKRKA